MTQLIFVLCAFVFSFYRHADAFSGGAPVETCISMAPNENRHGAGPQTGEAPYAIQVDKTYYNENSKVKVYIEALGDDNIEGFIIEAREIGKTKALGSFTIPSKTQALDCTAPAYGAETKYSVVTHNTPVGEKKLEFEWTPYKGSTATGNIYFVATVVQNRMTYWLRIESAELSPMNSSEIPLNMSTMTPLPKMPPMQPISIDVAVTKMPMQMSDIYKVTKMPMQMSDVYQVTKMPMTAVYATKDIQPTPVLKDKQMISSTVNEMDPTSTTTPSSAHTFVPTIFIASFSLPLVLLSC